MPRDRSEFEFNTPGLWNRTRVAGWKGYRNVCFGQLSELVSEEQPEHWLPLKSQPTCHHATQVTVSLRLIPIPEAGTGGKNLDVTSRSTMNLVQSL